MPRRTHTNQLLSTCTGTTPCATTGNASLFQEFYATWTPSDVTCTNPPNGGTPCFTTANSTDFISFYQNYDVQGWCENEPLACYLNGGTACPPDCGGAQGAAYLEYGCNPENMGPMGLMDCEQLYVETGICFDVGNINAPNSGVCESSGDFSGPGDAASEIYGCNDGWGLMDCEQLYAETGTCFDVGNANAPNSGTCNYVFEEEYATVSMCEQAYCLPNGGDGVNTFSFDFTSGDEACDSIGMTCDNVERGNGWPPSGIGNDGQCITAPDTWDCTGDGTECINPNKACTGDEYCSNGSDEAYCNPTWIDFDTSPLTQPYVTPCQYEFNIPYGYPVQAQCSTEPHDRNKKQSEKQMLINSVLRKQRNAK